MPELIERRDARAVGGVYRDGEERVGERRGMISRP
jgi:hypothetical protein